MKASATCRIAMFGSIPAGQIILGRHWQSYALCPCILGSCSSYSQDFHSIALVSGKVLFAVLSHLSSYSSSWEGSSVGEIFRTALGEDHLSCEKKNSQPTYLRCASQFCSKIRSSVMWHQYRIFHSSLRFSFSASYIERSDKYSYFSM